MPAGTGVWVVNTVPARTACSASSKVRPVPVDELADALDAEEAGVALVGVEDLRRGRAGDRAVGAHGADAADAEQQLLLQPVLAAAAVEPVGDLARRRRRSPRRRCRAAAAAPGRPGRARPGRAACAPSGSAERDAHRRAVGVASSCHRQAVRVERRVGLQLPAVARQRLAEVAAPVEQADADDRHAEVAGRLQVVAGQDAEAAGVLRQHLGDAELRARSRRSTSGRSPARGLLAAGTSAAAVEVVVQVVVRRRQPAQELRSRGERGEPLGAHLAEQPDRVAAARCHSSGVDRLEQVARLRVPRPAQVDRRARRAARVGAGSAARTVNRRSAFTRRTLAAAGWLPGHRVPRTRALTVAAPRGCSTARRRPG